MKVFLLIKEKIYQPIDIYKKSINFKECINSIIDLFK